MDNNTLMEVSSATSPVKAFYDTYGFIVLRNCGFLDYIDSLRFDFDSYFSREYGVAWSNTPQKPIINRMRDFHSLTALIKETKLLHFVDSLMGPDWTFMSVDYSVFLGTIGSPAHRDGFPSFSTLKVGIYLQDQDVNNGGVFQVIPGSHRFQDAFAHDVGFGLKWPRGSGYDTLMVSDVDFSTKEEGFRGTMNLPYFPLELRVGDILFFDNRLVHQVTPSKYPIRRMIALCFLEGFSSFHRKFPMGNADDYIRFIVGDYCDSSAIVESHFGKDVHVLDLTQDEPGVDRLYTRYYPRVRKQVEDRLNSKSTDSTDLIDRGFCGIQGRNLWPIVKGTTGRY